MNRAATQTAGVAALLLAASLPVAASAGAWVQPEGHGQVIVKYEDMTARDAFDADGQRTALAVERRETALGVFAEYGLTDRLTLQVKGDWQDGQDQFVDYQGRGPIEVAVVWQAWRNDRAAITLQGGYSAAGEGRNAGYEAPGQGDGDWEVRASAGWSFADTPPKRRWQRWLHPTRSFVEVQVAQRFRGGAGLSDETRADVTLGRHFGDRWMVLNQTYAGRTDDGTTSWVQSETSLVRRLGSWNVQGGWRYSTYGQNTPASGGPVVALWRRF